MSTSVASGHVPVFLNEVLNSFGENREQARHYFDGTFGRGGHAKAVLEKFPMAELWAFDQDEDAIRFGREAFPDPNRAHFFHANYADFEAVSKREAGFPKSFDLMLLDLGVSSPQLDEAHRGF